MTFTDTQLEEAASVLKAIAHDVRLKLLRTLLEHGEKSVGELEALTGIGQPGLSQQLAILRKAELVQTRRDAKLVFYSIVSANMEGTAKLLCALAGTPINRGDTAAKTKRPFPQGSVATFAKIL